jgi:hypothetical protein
VRKITKKLQHPNLIVNSLDRPVYASTYCSIICDAQGPNCHYDIDEKDGYKEGWTEAEGRYRDYNWHICPSCQKTNCMQCGKELKESGQCPNPSCDNYTWCKDCEEELFKNRYGDAYCINPDCENNKPNMPHREAHRDYWVQCDGPGQNSAKYQDQNGNWHHVKIDEASDEIKNNPTYERYCDADGWNPEYDHMPKGWHRREHDRNGEISTDYCEDCWETGVCHECENPYTDEEEKFREKAVCKNPSCDYFNKCQHCYADVNEFGNCKHPEEGYGDCWPCRHCGKELEDGGICYNEECEAFDHGDYANYFKNKKASYDWEDDPDYPEEPTLYINCDRPGCNVSQCAENIIWEHKMMPVGNNDNMHYCEDCYNDYVCPECHQPDLNLDDECRNSACPTNNKCKDCGSSLGSYGQCPYCDGTNEEYLENYANAFRKKSRS